MGKIGTNKINNLTKVAELEADNIEKSLSLTILTQSAIAKLIETGVIRTMNTDRLISIRCAKVNRVESAKETMIKRKLTKRLMIKPIGK